MDHSPLVERVRSEFIEMPGLRLTPAQAARLWGMDDASCHHVISALVRAERSADQPAREQVSNRLHWIGFGIGTFALARAIRTFSNICEHH